MFPATGLVAKSGHNQFEHRINRVHHTCRRLERALEFHEIGHLLIERNTTVGCTLGGEESGDDLLVFEGFIRAAKGCTVPETMSAMAP